MAHMHLVTNYIIIIKCKVDMNVLKKITGSSNHSKVIIKFFRAIYQDLL